MTEENFSHQVSEKEVGFDKIIFKILSFLKLTSGTGLVGLGGFWFLYGILQFIFVSAESAVQQQVQETFFLQAELGVLIVGIGILIREVKKTQFKDTYHNQPLNSNLNKEEVIKPQQKDTKHIQSEKILSMKPENNIVKDKIDEKYDNSSKHTSFSFNCPKCASQISIKFLKPGEVCKCKNCGVQVKIPNDPKD